MTQGRDPWVQKLVLGGMLAIALTIPITWVQSLVAERRMRSEGVRRELAATWGGAQRLVGPVLRVPYQDARPTTSLSASPASPRRWTCWKR